MVEREKEGLELEKEEETEKKVENKRLSEWGRGESNAF